MKPIGLSVFTKNQDMYGTTVVRVNFNKNATGYV